MVDSARFSCSGLALPKNDTLSATVELVRDVCSCVVLVEGVEVVVVVVVETTVLVTVVDDGMRWRRCKAAAESLRGTASTTHVTGASHVGVVRLPA